MTLDERIKASAEELGRLLREAEAEHQKRMAERDKMMEGVPERAEGLIARFFKELEDLAKPIMVTVDNGKALEDKEFGDNALLKDILDRIEEPLYIETERGREYNPRHFEFSHDARIMRRVLNRIMRLEEKIEKLEPASTSKTQAPGLNPPSADTLTTVSLHSRGVGESETIHNPQHSDPAEPPTPECEHKGGKCLLSLEDLNTLEVGEVLIPDGKMLSYHLIDAATGKEIQGRFCLIALNEYPGSE